MNKTIILSLLILAFLLVVIPSVSAIGNTSLYAVGFDVADFSFASSLYVKGVYISFNTTKTNLNVTLMTSMNVKKLTNGDSTNEVWARVNVDDVEKLKVKETIENDFTVGKAIRIPTETKKSSGIFLYLIALIAMSIVVLFSIAVMSQYKPPKGGDFIPPVRPRIVFDKTIVLRKKS